MGLLELGIKEEFETKTNDFKRYLNGGDKSFGWLKTVAGFANTSGGTMYVGIDDDGYSLIGMDKKTVDSQVQLFLRESKEHIHPEPNVDIRYIEVNKEEEKYVIEFFVHLSSSRPVIVSYGGTGSIFVRDEGKSRLATTEEIQRMAIQSAYTEYDNVYSNILYKKDDFSKMHGIYKDKTGKELTEKELFSVGFFNDRKALRHASLLFSDSYNGEETALSITDYMGLGKGGNTSVVEPLFKGNILEAITLVQSYFEKKTKRMYLKQASGGLDYYSYPPRAVMEAIVNAYAHKNYLYEHTQIEVNLYLDRAEFVSPGSIVGRESFNKRKDLSSLIPMRRNPFICDVLALLHLMERKGSGFDKIESEYSPFPSSFQPFAKSNEESFTLVLPDLSYPYGVADADNTNLDLVYPSIIAEKSSTKEILSYCYFAKRSLSDIASFLGVAVSSYLRNNILGALIERNLLSKEKIGNKEFYRANPLNVKIRGDGN